VDPKLVVLEFNECISNGDVGGLGQLMSDDHVFIDREGNATRTKEEMLNGWIRFFEMFPGYKNTFERVESKGNHVFVLGFAYWSGENQHDPAIWTATILNDLVAEWHIYYDTEENRERFRLR